MPNTETVDDRELLQVRLWSRVIPFDVRDPDACAIFGGHTLPSGYGTLNDPSTGEPLYAHRVSWELVHGKIPPKKQGEKTKVVRHLCSNPSCVRPGHLMIGTQKDNMADKVSQGRTRVLPKLTDSDVIAIRYLMATGRFSQGDLAELFLGSGQGQPTIARIVQGKSYKHLNGPITRGGRGKRPPRREQ
jgi:hypothetical protein